MSEVAKLYIREALNVVLDLNEAMPERQLLLDALYAAFDALPVALEDVTEDAAQDAK